MSVPITYRQKMDFSFCVYMVGFPKYGHIRICMYVCMYVHMYVCTYVVCISIRIVQSITRRKL